MLLPLRLGPVTISVAGYRGLAFEPLVNAAASGDDLAPALLSITEQFGFEGFAHGFVLRLRPEAEGEVFLFSTYSIEWMREYDQRAYVEVDPRVKACASTALPVIWDQSTFRGQSRASSTRFRTLGPGERHRQRRVNRNERQLRSRGHDVAYFANTHHGQETFTRDCPKIGRDSSSWAMLVTRYFSSGSRAAKPDGGPCAKRVVECAIENRVPK